MAASDGRVDLDIERLSQAERQVLDLARDGLSAAEIADRLSITEATVRSHLSRIYGKLRVRGRVELLARLRPDPDRTMSLDAESNRGDGVPGVPSADRETGLSPNSRPRRRATFAQALPWFLGAVAGLMALILWFPLLNAHGFPAPAIPLVVVAGVVAVLVARRPGGLAFLSAALGVDGALAIALAISVPLSCPAGEFSSECSYPSLARIIVPGLGLLLGGALLASRAIRGRRAG